MVVNVIQFDFALEMTSKPPLCGRLTFLCAAELWVVNAAIIPEVVFTWHRPGLCIKLTAGGSAAVNVQEVDVSGLPEWHRNMYSYVSPNVDVLHFFAYSTPKEIDNIEVLEAATDVVSEIDTMLRIAAGCPPVGGMTL